MVHNLGVEIATCLHTLQIWQGLIFISEQSRHRTNISAISSGGNRRAGDNITKDVQYANPSSG